MSVNGHFTKIINESLTINKFPDDLKLADVTPTFKSGDKTNVKNYRPISVLQTVKNYVKLNFLILKIIYPHIFVDTRKATCFSITYREMESVYRQSGYTAAILIGSIKDL